MNAREHRLYLMRLVAKLWHVHVHMSILLKENTDREAFGSLEYLKDHDPISNRDIPKRSRFFGGI